MGCFRLVMVTGVLAGLLACSGPEVRYDYDVKANFSSYKTFDWQAAPRQVAGRAGGFDNAIMNGRVKRAVETELAAKGFRKEGGPDPDFLVSDYPVRQGTRSHQVHLGMGFGMGPVGVGVGAPVGDPHAEAPVSLVLEIQDFRTRTMVWKATAVKALEGSDSPEEADEAVETAVATMLKRFPPK